MTSPVVRCCRKAAALPVDRLGRVVHCGNVSRSKEPSSEGRHEHATFAPLGYARNLAPAGGRLRRQPAGRRGNADADLRRQGLPDRFGLGKRGPEADPRSLRPGARRRSPRPVQGQHRHHARSGAGPQPALRRRLAGELPLDLAGRHGESRQVAREHHALARGLRREASRLPSGSAGSARKSKWPTSSRPRKPASSRSP